MYITLISSKNVQQCVLPLHFVQQRTIPNLQYIVKGSIFIFSRYVISLFVFGLAITILWDCPSYWNPDNSHEKLLFTAFLDCAWVLG